MPTNKELREMDLEPDCGMVVDANGTSSNAISYGFTDTLHFTEADAGKCLAVSAAGDQLEWITPGSGSPTHLYMHSMQWEGGAAANTGHLYIAYMSTDDTAYTDCQQFLSKISATAFYLPSNGYVRNASNVPCIVASAKKVSGTQVELQFIDAGAIGTLSIAATASGYTFNDTVTTIS